MSGKEERTRLHINILGESQLLFGKGEGTRLHIKILRDSKIGSNECWLILLESSDLASVSTVICRSQIQPCSFSHVYIKRSRSLLHIEFKCSTEYPPIPF